jgi:acyl-homoserine lactone acylase PvdQ
VFSVVNPLFSGELVDADALAERVTIYRDEFGVPHVFGADDEATIFGLG